MDSLSGARSLLHTWQLRDPERGWRNLTGLANALTLDGLRDSATPLGRLLPRCPDPDMALNNLERFLANPAAVAAAARPAGEPRPRPGNPCCSCSAPVNPSAICSSLNPDYLDMLRVPLRRSPSQDEMQAQLQAEVDAAYEDSAVLRAFRRFRQRQMLRIGTNDIIRDRPLEEITRDISRVADVALEVALTVALRQVGKRFGQPMYRGRPAGLLRRPRLRQARRRGAELLQRHRPDVRLRRGREPRAASASPASATTNSSAASSARWCGCCRRTPIAARPIRVDLRLRPEGHRGPLARSLASTLAYYDTHGPHLGTAGAHQGPARGRRPGPGRALPASDRAVCLPQISHFRRDQRDQGDQAADRAEDQPGRRQRHGGQDRPRRHPRHRVHHPVPATAQRRRSARRSASATPCWPCPPSSASAA